MSATSSTQHRKADEVRTKQQGPREGSVMWAVIQVLDGKRKPLTPAEILTEIQDRRLARKLDGKTPQASVAARLAVHAAKGLYVERAEKGKYQLKKSITATSLASHADAKPTGGKRKTASRNRRSTPAARPRKAQSEKPAQEREATSAEAVDPAQEPTAATA